MSTISDEEVAAWIASNYNETDAEIEAIVNAPQCSPMWHKARALRAATGSNIGKATRQNKYGSQKELLLQKVWPETHGVKPNFHMERGTRHEPDARQECLETILANIACEFDAGKRHDIGGSVGAILKSPSTHIKCGVEGLRICKQNKRFAYSTDGNIEYTLEMEGAGEIVIRDLIELKCPMRLSYAVLPEYFAQMQYGIWNYEQAGFFDRSRKPHAHFFQWTAGGDSDFHSSFYQKVPYDPEFVEGTLIPEYMKFEPRLVRAFIWKERGMLAPGNLEPCAFDFC